MEVDTILEDLFSRRTRGIKPGLERMIEAAEKLNTPQGRYSVVHVAGTNGKGSTASMISAVLTEAGHRVGLFTSPHILDFRERFIIAGEPVKDSEWIAVWEDIRDLCDSLELTFFEISALLAFELFSRAKCDYVVLETGLGGRLDATNICDPVLSVITALSVEHTEYLGDTIEEIAGEKLGIVKPGKPLVFNGNNPENVVALAKEKCRASNSEITLALTDSLPLLRKEKQSQIFKYCDGEITLPLMGDFQQQNCITAITTCEVLGIAIETIRNGIAKTFIPCRLQRVQFGEHQFLFDVAHNPQAVEILCSSLAAEPAHFLIGMMKDKEVDQMVMPIISIAKTITVVSPSIPRALSAHDLAEVVSERTDSVPVEQFPSLKDGVASLLEKDGLKVVTGSFFTVSEVLAELGISPFTRN